MGATLTTLIGTPIIVGKAFLTFKFVETAIAFLRFCTRIARLVTDPVVDICVEILKDVVLLPMFSSFRALENIAAKKLSLPHATAASDGRFSHALADLGSRIVILYDKQHVASVRLAASQTVIDRTWCMAVGYAVAISTVCLIAFAGEANLGRLSSGVVDQMRQHGKFLKLALFMALEMVMFPIVAGTAINYSLIPLFEGVTVATRIEQLRHTPFGLIFVNWIIGTRWVKKIGMSLTPASCMVFRRCSLIYARPCDRELYSSFGIHPTRATRRSRTSWSGRRRPNYERCVTSCQRG